MSFPESQRIIDKLKGQGVRIPNLYAVLEGWQSRVNPHMNTVEKLIDQVLEKYSFSESMTAKLKAADLPLFVSAWFPYASVDILRDLTYFTGWMFLVDDQLDQLSGPDEASATAFKDLTRDTIIYIEHSLDIKPLNRPLEKLYPGVESFKETGEALRKRYNLEQRNIFLEEARLTMNMYQVENDIRHSKRIPTNEEYWAYRQGSSCIGMVVAMIEFANRLCIPEDIMQHSDMKIIRREANAIHWIMNDIVSAKKEIGGGFVENLVAPYARPECDGQVGIDAAIEFVRQSVKRFRAAEARLNTLFEPGMQEANMKQPASYDPRLAKQLKTFLEGCKRMCVGNIDWSLATQRYGFHTAERDSNGGVIFSL